MWTREEIRAAANSTFAIGGVSCSADSLVVVDNFVLRINICAEKPAHRKSAKRYEQWQFASTRDIKTTRVNFTLIR